MVTLKVLNAEAAKREREDRIERARRCAAKVEAQNVRRFVEEKVVQEELVAADLRKKWESERSEVAAQRQKLLGIVHERRGEGMRGAQQYNADRTQLAQNEALAWEAERALERQRHAVSLQRLHLKRLQEENEKELRGSRRQLVKSIEEQRSKRRVAEHNSASMSSVSIQSRSSVSPQQKSMLGHTELHIRAGVEESALMKARQHDEQSRMLRNEKEAKAKEQQLKAAERVAKMAEEQRLVEEEKRARAEQEAVLHLRMKEQAMQSHRHVLHADSQEQEARHSHVLNRRLHVEFEQLFLQDVWKPESFKLESPVVVPLAFDSLVTAASFNYAPHFTLESHHFSVRLLIESTPEDTAQDSAEERPQRETVPAPSPREVAAEHQIEPQRPSETEEGTAEGANGDKASPLSSATHIFEQTSTAASSTADPYKLRMQNEKFMADLATLRQRLAAAAAAAAVDSDEEADGVADEVTVSTMSSPEKQDHRGPLA